MNLPKVVSRDEWRAARQASLVKEKAAPQGWLRRHDEYERAGAS